MEAAANCKTPNCLMIAPSKVMSLSAVGCHKFAGRRPFDWPVRTNKWLVYLLVKLAQMMSMSRNSLERLFSLSAGHCVEMCLHMGGLDVIIYEWTG